jgi:hypothetical protein
LRARREAGVIACGAIARELTRIRAANGWDHVDIRCLPPALHNHPERIPAAVERLIREQLGSGRHLFVAYADCGTGGKLDRVLDKYGVRRLAGAHCYECLAGSGRFHALAAAEPGTFYLTDFLVRHFQRLVVDGLGLDRNPQLRNAYFGNYRRLVYLAQTRSDRLQTLARRHARTLGLEYGHVFTGDHPLALRLRSGLAASRAAAGASA